MCHCRKSAWLILGCVVLLGSPPASPGGPTACGQGEPKVSSAADVAPGQVDDRLVTADNAFGFRLFSQLVAGGLDGNVFISPVSIAFDLAMTLNGAAGETYQAMAEALGVQDLEMEEINEAGAGLIGALVQPDPKVDLRIANSLWAKKHVRFLPEFLQANENYYGARVTSLDLQDPDAVSAINDWVGEATENRIPEIVDEVPEEAILYLIDAVYFRGLWTEPFDEAKTDSGPFTLLDGTTKIVRMMRRFGSWDYLAGEGFQAIRLPYGAGRVGAYVFLPDRDSDLDEFLSVLSTSPDVWDAWLSRLERQAGRLALPRFQLDHEVQLGPALGAMGMGVAFDENSADFSRMARGPVWIGEVKHKTFVAVDEQGTEAAAVTSALMLAAEIPPPRFSMIVDRPFFFAIVDGETGTILFMGAIVEPL